MRGGRQHAAAATTAAVSLRPLDVEAAPWVSNLCDSDSVSHQRGSDGVSHPCSLDCISKGEIDTNRVASAALALARHLVQWQSRVAREV